jgi:hypothetical protein
MQWGDYPRNEHDAAGIELGQVTDVKISNIDMNFKSRPSHGGGPVGMCLAIDIGTHKVDARNVRCIGGWGGALITLDSIGSIIATAADLEDTVSGIYITNFTFDGNTATGFKSGWRNSTMKNIIWDGVNVINGNPASAALCWMRTHSSTPYPSLCAQQLVSTVTDIWFKRFRGKISGVPSGREWQSPNNMTVTEYHFEDWQNTVV